MDFTTTMRFVLLRAQAEAHSAEIGSPHPEHIFLGILKLSELTAEEAFASSRDKAGIDADIQSVKNQLAKLSINSTDARQILRRALRVSPHADDADANIATLLANALKKTNDDRLSANLVLQAMLENPTPMLKSMFFDKKSIKPLKHDMALEQHKQDPNDPPDPPDKQSSAESLSRLSERVTIMQYTLLENVRGQDHAVHAFAQGVFNAEVLAAADEKRVQPRAVFVFAGPPGVGKTFLAEQAAQALGIPFMRFDMSGYSDHQANVNLIGINPSFKESKPGILTAFVKDNPHSLLLFDEIEKAHINTIHLFLQLLDAGVLRDDYTDENVVFKDTLIVFTTNAGRSLYTDGTNTAGSTTQIIMDALESDIDQRTGRPFFPAAICSRLATGYPVLFNHLLAHDLAAIAERELQRQAGLFKEQYDITVGYEELLPFTMLYSVGGHADARKLRAKTEQFFKNEVYKLCRLWDVDNRSEALAQLADIRFTVETETSAAVRSLFFTQDRPTILFYGENQTADNLRNNLSEYELLYANNEETALKIISENEVLYVILECRPAQKAVAYSETVYLFEHIPFAASTLKNVTTVFTTIRERLPELPIYLLDTDALPMDDTLTSAFLQKGARGKIMWPKEDFSVFLDDLVNITRHLTWQKTAATLLSEQKILAFETAPVLSANKQEAQIRLRSFTLQKTVQSGGAGNLLDEVSKPDTRFSDVIGADDAKEELQFFTTFLKNPKKFAAQGLMLPKGVLLYGPPGTGKTLLAKAMAGESGLAFLSAVGSGFVTKWRGSGEEAVRDLFSRARQHAPAIIFIDEIDAIGRVRGGRQSSHGEEMALNALLAEMDGFSVDQNRPVFLLAATNFDVEEGKGGMGVLDPALVRRFDRSILVELPDRAARKSYIEMKLAILPAHKITQEMIERLAVRSPGLSLANLEMVLNLALRNAVKNNQALDDDILSEAFELTEHGPEKNWGIDYLERVARHEAGHAYISHFSGNTPNYVTIVSRGSHGGYMEHSDDAEKPLFTKDELNGRIRAALGGRAAELIYYGKEDGLSSGASNDLKAAASIARKMICEYGMDNQFGLLALAPSTAIEGIMGRKVTKRVSKMLKTSLKEAVKLIKVGKPKIELLVSALLEKNKLTKEEIEEILM
ncbi:MAG: AAA family ATPase [Oscillospiraceae bacterium]|nr:AAA family ATPase [Oscillospiraceae bacterium]